MNTMKTESGEHLSSLMDGEVSQETGRFLVRRLAADAALRDTWDRYHLIRDCLRHQDGHFAHQDLSQRLSKVLAEESTPAGGPTAVKSWFRPVAGAAIAASVALFAVLTVSTGKQTEIIPATAPGVAQEAAVKPFTSPNISTFVPDSRPVNLSGQIQPDNQKMNAYLLRHYQVAGEAGKGFVSFVPIVVTAAPAEPGADDPEVEKEPTSPQP